MKKQIVVIIYLTLFAQSFFGQQCFSYFTYDIDYEVVTFQNKSTIKNAHYYWNFGDGTSSYFEHPIHNYYESGTYFVTLFINDTINNCSSFFEQWIEVEKYNKKKCEPKMDYILSTENNGDVYLELNDLSQKCDTVYRSAYIGISFGYPINQKLFYVNIPNYGFGHALFLSKIQFYKIDSLSGWYIDREAYKTFPFMLNNTQNYNACSANFEFEKILSDTIGKRVKFIPMNKKAKNYKWIITGYGNPIVSNYDTMSYNFYPFYNEFETITLITEDYSGCRDTMTQQIQLKKEITTTEGKLNDCELNALISPNPINNVLTLNFEIGDIKPNEITIIDEIGKVVYSQKGHFNLINYQYKINVDNLNSGVYFLSMKGDCYNYKSKFLKL